MGECWAAHWQPGFILPFHQTLFVGVLAAEACLAAVSACLADLRVARQAVRVLQDGGRRGAAVGAVADLDDGAPLGKPRTLLVVLLAPLAQTVQALSLRKQMITSLMRGKTQDQHGRAVLPCCVFWKGLGGRATDSAVTLGDGNGTVELLGVTSLPMHCVSLAPEPAVSPVWQSRRRCPAARLGLHSVPLPDANMIYRM